MSNVILRYNPLTVISDRQWIEFVEFLSENVLALNNRLLAKLEILHTEGGHYPAVYFRLTTIADQATKGDMKTEVSGFVLGFNNDWDDDVYIHPLSPQGFWENWLNENGINTIFNYHEVGLRKLYGYIEKELKLWETPENPVPINYVPDEWREIFSIAQ